MTKNFSNLKVAIINDFFYWYGGAQKVEEALIKIFPNADFYSGFKHPKYDNWIPKNIKYTFVNKLPFKGILSPLYELLLPFSFENLNLENYDVIISSTSIFSKGVIAPPSVINISYIHTPPRFLWGLEASRQSKWRKVFKLPFVLVNHFLRIWDYYSAQRPNVLIANSEEVSKRIKAFYHRDSVIINPPVSFSLANNKTQKRQDNTFLYLGRLVSYKKVDILIKAFRSLPDKKLVIAGDGDQITFLKNLARGSDNITFEGFVNENRKWELLNSVQCLIHISLEDFGITPVEALSCGTPVLGLNAGGTKEIINSSKYGLLIDNQSESDLINAINSFKFDNYKIKDLKNRAEEYSFSCFKKKILNLISSLV